MINVKEAIKSSTSFVQELFPGARDIQLEEVEPWEDEWSVGLSFNAFGADSALAAVMCNGRTLKRVLLDLESGELKALRVWQVAEDD